MFFFFNRPMIEVEIDNGKVLVKEPEKLPAHGKGLLAIVPTRQPNNRRRVQFPLIPGDGTHMINPTKEQLDASLWD